MNLPGYPFQYFFNVASTGFINTLQGEAWQNQFINGEVKASEALQSSIDYFQEWIDCGMINENYGIVENSELLAHFEEGNTAFLLGGMEISMGSCRIFLKMEAKMYILPTIHVCMD